MIGCFHKVAVLKDLMDLFNNAVSCRLTYSWLAALF
jgi:hypothetical protein